MQRTLTASWRVTTRLADRQRVRHQHFFRASLHYEAIFRENEKEQEARKSYLANSGRRCAGRRVLLTGGTSGIGLAVAERLLYEGIEELVIITRDEKRGREAISQLKKSDAYTDIKITALEADITNGPATYGPVTEAMREMVRVAQTPPLLSLALTGLLTAEV